MDIQYYERQCKLNLPEDERTQLLPRAGELIESFKTLDAIDTRGALPMVSVLDITNIMREDMAVKAIPRDELLENAPEQYGGYFQVPRTVD